MEIQTAKKWMIRPALLFWLFVLGSVAGFLLEGLWCLVQKGHWENHSALVWGPFCVVYGIGAVLIYLLAVFLNNKLLILQFLSYFAAGFLVEYVTSFVQELCFGSVSWDYSAHFLNIGGRVSLKMTLLWGVLGILFIKLIFPFIQKWAQQHPPKAIVLFTRICVVFILINLVVSSAAVICWRWRQDDIPPRNAAEQFMSRHFGNEWMAQQYPNMQFVSDGDLNEN